MMRPEQQFENHWPGPEAPDSSSFQTTSPENSRPRTTPTSRVGKKAPRAPSTCVVILRAHELYSATMAVFHEDELHDCFLCKVGEQTITATEPGPHALPSPRQTGPGCSWHPCTVGWGLVTLLCTHNLLPPSSRPAPATGLQGRGLGLVSSSSFSFSRPLWGHLGRNTTFPSRDLKSPPDFCFVLFQGLFLNGC